MSRACFFTLFLINPFLTGAHFKSIEAQIVVTSKKLPSSNGCFMEIQCNSSLEKIKENIICNQRRIFKTNCHGLPIFRLKS